MHFLIRRKPLSLTTFNTLSKVSKCLVSFLPDTKISSDQTFTEGIEASLLSSSL